MPAQPGPAQPPVLEPACSDKAQSFGVGVPSRGTTEPCPARQSWGHPAGTRRSEGHGSPRCFPQEASAARPWLLYVRSSAAGAERGRAQLVSRPLLAFSFSASSSWCPPSVPPSLPAALGRPRERRPPRQGEGRRCSPRAGSWMRTCPRARQLLGHEGDRGDAALPCSRAGTSGKLPTRLPGPARAETLPVPGEGKRALESCPAAAGRGAKGRGGGVGWHIEVSGRTRWVLR